jgi:hypothetical protein
METINSSDRIVFLRDIFCLRNICINTLHKGDSGGDDDDNNNNNSKWLLCRQIKLK